MNDESPENIAENEAMYEIHVFCRLLKQEYGGRLLSRTFCPCMVVVLFSRVCSSSGGWTGDALTSSSMEALGIWCS